MSSASSNTVAVRSPPPPGVSSLSAASITGPSSNSDNAAPKKVRPVTPSSRHHQDAASLHLHKRMSVDKDVYEELLLVCSVIGTTISSDKSTANNTEEDKDNSDNNVQLLPVTDCLNWLQDLQRTLRRDDDLYRPISLKICALKIIPQKLLPLIMSCRYDSAVTLTILKILVLLTKPLASNTKAAACQVIDTKNKKVPEIVIKQQIKLRENALQQADMLMEFKRAVCYFKTTASSAASEKKGSNSNSGVLSVFVSLLAEPLSKSGTARSEQDHLTTELVLHLICNLLSAQPLTLTNDAAKSSAARLQSDFICLLQKELALEVLLVLAAELEQRENAAYNLLVMEILGHLLHGRDPAAVAIADQEQKRHHIKKQLGSTNKATGRPTHRPAGSLSQQLRREKQSLTVIPASRHSHFGGTLVLGKQNQAALGKGGKQQYVSAQMAFHGGRHAGAQAQQQLQPRKRKHKLTEPFIGANRATAEIQASSSGPAAVRANAVLNNFCNRFVKECYGPTFKSLKNEFRRDSARLEEKDQVVFFRIVCFFCQWWRFSRKQQQRNQKENNASDTSLSSIGQLIFTMDVFTFQMVFSAVDYFQQHKKHPALQGTVAVLAEMMQLLLFMFSSTQETERIMAAGLMDRLYYGSEPVDRLPKLLQQWAPATYTSDYLTNLVQITHTTLKLLQANHDIVAKGASAALENATNDEKDKSKVKDRLAQMRDLATEFDVSAYFLRKIVSNKTVTMYTKLLSQYASNTAVTNHCIISFFLKLSSTVIYQPEDKDDNSIPRNLLASKRITLEPMLFNVDVLMTVNTILNDSTIRRDVNFRTLLAFCARFMSNWSDATANNEFLPVEAMVKHVVPHRYCDLVTNCYVNEELRMIAEKDLLMEESARYEQAMTLRNAAAAEEEEEESSDEELEFEDTNATSVTTSPQSREKKRARQAIIDSSDEDEEKEVHQEQERNTSTSTELKQKPKYDDNGDNDYSMDEGDHLIEAVAKKSAKSRMNLQKRLESINEGSDRNTNSEEEDSLKGSSKDVDEEDAS